MFYGNVGGFYWLHVKGKIVITVFATVTLLSPYLSGSGNTADFITFYASYHLSVLYCLSSHLKITGILPFARLCWAFKIGGTGLNNPCKDSRKNLPQSFPIVLVNWGLFRIEYQV